MVKVMKRELGHLLLTETIDGCCSPARLPSPEVQLADMTQRTRQSGRPVLSTNRHPFMCTVGSPVQVAMQLVVLCG